MNGDDRSDEYRIGIRIADPELAQRLGELFAATPGVRIVTLGEQPDLVVSVAARDGDGDFAVLTARERDVLMLLAEGLSNRAIAARLGIAPDTAKFHVGRLLDKLDATGRTDAVAHAVRRGIIHL